MECGSDSDEEMRLNPRSPAFRNLQMKLGRQLEEVANTVAPALSEQRKKKAKLVETRQQVGETLYNAQQMLAAVQGQLRSAQKEFEECVRQRKEGECMVEAERAVLDGKREGLRLRMREYEVVRGELNDVDNEVRRIEEERQSEASEVMLHRRAAYKVEKAITEQEVVKNEQDFYIERLYERIESMKRRIAKLDAQIEAQSGETKIGKEAVLKAEYEAARLKFEREQMMRDWDGAVLGVKLRLMTLEKIEDANNEQQARVLEMQNEMEILKMKREEAKMVFERNSEILARIQRVVERLDDKISKVQRAMQEKKSQQEEYAQKIPIMEGRVRETLAEREAVRQEYHDWFQNRNDLSQRVRELEKEVESAEQERKQRVMMITAAARKAMPLRRVADLKKQELCNLANEKIRLQIELMNGQNAVKRLQQEAKETKEQMEEQNRLLDQYEADMEKNNKEIDQKLSELDRLYQVYESKRSKAQESMGDDPIMASIADLQEKIRKLRQKAEEKQDMWIHLQADMLEISQECKAIQDEETKLRAELGAMQRKRDKTAAQLGQIEAHNQKCQAQVRVFQRELEKLGLQLREKTGSPVQIKSRMIAILTAKEKEVVELQSKIELVHENRNEIAEQLLLTENNIAVLEHKIKLTENAKPKLDEEAEERELKAMKVAMSKLEERWALIRKHQEMVTTKLEESFKNREPVQKIPEKSDEIEYKHLKSELNRIRAETSRSDKEITEAKKARNDLKLEIAQCDEILSEYESQVDEFNMILHEQERLHSNLKAKLAKLKLQNRYYLNSNHRAQASTFIEERAQLAAQIDEIILLIDSLREEFPDATDDLSLIQEQMQIMSSE